MKERLFVQVTYETDIEIDIPDGVDAEDFLCGKGLEICDRLNDMATTVHIDKGDGAKLETLYWGITRAEFMSEDGFVGDYQY